MRVLIADFDPSRSQVLSDACLARGYVVDRVRHGAAALETALDRVPGTVVCPIDLPVIDGVRLSEILRGNPRLRHASFVFLVKDELDAPMAMDPRDSVVVSPWLREDVLEHISLVADRNERFGGLRPESEIEGKLSQISVVDLLQMFQMNQKTGVVRIFRTGSQGSGTIQVRRGQVNDAWIPLPDGSSVVGEKALYRMLSWRDGRFEFVPEAVPEGGRIHQPSRALLLEGMRQMDEWQRLSADLPDRDARIFLAVPRESVPAHDHPLTREVLDAVEAYRRVGEILDHCAFPDYQVLRVLHDLLGREALSHERLEGTAAGVAAGGEGMFSAPQTRRLREWAASLGPRQSAVIKMLAVSAQRDVMRAFHKALRECADFMSEPRLMSEPDRIGGLGTLGHLSIGEGVSVRIVGVPAGETYAPVWDVASHGMLGAVVLPSGPYGPALEETEAIFQRLQSGPCARVVHLILGPNSGSELSRETHDRLAELAGGGVFVLPEGSRGERLEVLRNAFARLVP
jgi:CheY-like chemotaxis protein